MENYFNYFTEIEEYFWKKRGTALLISTLDWALIDSWKEAQIPLEAVLQGIDRAFEKQESRRNKARKVNSLAYCHQEILAATAEKQRSTLHHGSEGGSHFRARNWQRSWIAMPPLWKMPPGNSRNKEGRNRRQPFARWRVPWLNWQRLPDRMRR